MRVRVRIETGRDVDEFVKVTEQMEVPVFLVDGDNEDNFVSGKSLMCAVLTLNWDNLYCVCSRDISFAIRKFIVEE